MEARQLVWSMFFSSIAGFQYHPANRQRMSIEEIALVADAMYHEFFKRFGES